MVSISRVSAMFGFQLTGFVLFSLSTIHPAFGAPASFSQVLNLEVKNAYEWVSYGEQSQQTLVKFTQSTNKSDAILIIHGGCWSNAYDVAHALPMAQALSESGFDVWAAEYRRVGDQGGGWPGSLADIKAAIRYVNESSGKTPLLIGHSAGGHLALKASEDPNLSIHGVVALAPITNLVSYGAEEGSCQSMVSKLMGDDSYLPTEAYRDASVNIAEISIPIKVIIGTADPIVGTNQVENFSASQLSWVAEAGHFDLIHPKTPAFETVRSIIESLFTDKTARPSTGDTNSRDSLTSVTGNDVITSGPDSDHLMIAGDAQ